MNLAQALQAAARRYCNERFKHWSTKYSEIVRGGRDRASDGYHYTSEALRVFPRYNVLKAIRVEIEGLEPAELVDLAETRELILIAGRDANDDFTRNPLGPIDADAMADEREAFCNFVCRLSDVELQSTKPLPYQRVLSPSESELVWARISERWQIKDDFWFPLAECAVSDVAAFQDRHFLEFCSSFDLPALLSSRGVSRVWELRESGLNYEKDVSLFDPYYDGTEGYWSSGELDWIVYASHESSITLGGWLLRQVKDQWPEWHRRIWETPFF